MPRLSVRTPSAVRVGPGVLHEASKTVRHTAMRRVANDMVFLLGVGPRIRDLRRRARQTLCPKAPDVHRRPGERSGGRGAMMNLQSIRLVGSSGSLEEEASMLQSLT